MTTDAITRERPTPGSLLRAAATLLRERFGTLALIAVVPILLPTAWYYQLSYSLSTHWRASKPNPTEFFTRPDTWASFLLLMIVQQFAQAALAHFVFERASGREVSSRDALVQAVGRLAPLAGVSLLFTLATLGGMVLCCVPGVLAWLAYAVAGPVCMVERLGVTASLRRSKDLTKGVRWAVFGSFMLAYLPVLAATMLSQVLLRDRPAALYSVEAVFGCVNGLLFGTLTAVAYERIRTFKEGGPVEQAAAVFE